MQRFGKPALLSLMVLSIVSCAAELRGNRDGRAEDLGAGETLARADVSSTDAPRADATSTETPVADASVADTSVADTSLADTSVADTSGPRPTGAFHEDYLPKPAPSAPPTAGGSAVTLNGVGSGESEGGPANDNVTPYHWSVGRTSSVTVNLEKTSVTSLVVF